MDKLVHHKYTLWRQILVILSFWVEIKYSMIHGLPFITDGSTMKWGLATLQRCYLIDSVIFNTTME